MGSKVSKAKKNSVSATKSLDIKIEEANLSTENEMDDVAAKPNYLSNKTIVTTADSKPFLNNDNKNNNNTKNHVNSENNEIHSKPNVPNINEEPISNKINADENSNTMVVPATKSLVPILVNSNLNKKSNGNIVGSSARVKSVIAMKRQQSQVDTTSSSFNEDEENRASRMKGVRFAEEVHVINEVELIEMMNNSSRSSSFFGGESSSSSRLAHFFKKSSSKRAGSTSSAASSPSSPFSYPSSPLPQLPPSPSSSKSEKITENGAAIKAHLVVFKENSFFTENNTKQTVVK